MQKGSISRRTFIGGAAAAAGAAAIGGYFAFHSQPSRPNIILFIADDMRFDAAGFAGGAIIKTPVLDRLAASGVVFDNNFVTTSVCPISRASIMTGEYALWHGVYGFHQPILPRAFSQAFFLHLRHAGYYTGFLGKWGIAGPMPVRFFDRWYGYQGQGEYHTPGVPVHMTDWQTHDALNFLPSRPKDKPFLLVVAYKAPHDPLIPQQRFAALYNKDVFPRPKTDAPAAAATLPPLLASSKGHREYKTGLGSDVLYESYMPNYYSLITGIDDSLGQIFSEMDAQDITGRTSVLFTSDNGMMLGEHELYGKWCMYEESIRVPLVVRPAPEFYPDIRPGRRAAMSLNIDLAPTMLAMASLPIPPHVKGKSLLPVMRKSDAPWRQGFYYEHPEWPWIDIVGCSGYRGYEWKYGRYFQGQKFNDCLFNLAKDPLELDNLAGKPEYKGWLEQMRRITLHERWMMRA